MLSLSIFSFKKLSVWFWEYTHLGFIRIVTEVQAFMVFPLLSSILVWNKVSRQPVYIEYWSWIFKKNSGLKRIYSHTTIHTFPCSFGISFGCMRVITNNDFFYYVKIGFWTHDYNGSSKLISYWHRPFVLVVMSWYFFMSSGCFVFQTQDYPK